MITNFINKLIQEMKPMSVGSVVAQAESDVSQLAPNTPAAQAIEAVAATVVSPNILNIFNDLQLAHTLYVEVKGKLAAQTPDSHNRILAILKAIF